MRLQVINSTDIFEQEFDPNSLWHPRSLFREFYFIGLLPLLLDLWMQEFGDAPPQADYSTGGRLPEWETPIQSVFPYWWLKKISALRMVTDKLEENAPKSEESWKNREKVVMLSEKWLCTDWFTQQKLYTGDEYWLEGAIRRGKQYIKSV